MVLEKTLESRLDCKINSVNTKGNQSWIYIGCTDAEAETPILWPPDAKNGLIGKDPDAGKDWKREEKGTIKNEMVGWHHHLDGHEFEQALGFGDGQGSLACYSPRVTKSQTWLSDWTTATTDAREYWRQLQPHVAVQIPCRVLCLDISIIFCSHPFPFPSYFKKVCCWSFLSLVHWDRLWQNHRGNENHLEIRAQ